jgi:hypothetical protein
MEEPKRKRPAPKRKYRCDLHFDALLAWLKGQSVPGIRPIHILRKEIGSIIATRDGIFASSRYLRHSSIAITAKLYADAKKPIAAGIGSMLMARGETIPFSIASDHAPPAPSAVA